MIDVEITKQFNDNVMFPMDIYTINIYSMKTEEEKNQEPLFEDPMAYNIMELCGTTITEETVEVDE